MISLVIRKILLKRSAVRVSILHRHLTFGPEHDKLRETVKRIVDNEINPYVDEWEAKGQFPVRELYKKLGNAGLFGITRDSEYGGAGLDYSYSMVFFEEMGRVLAGGVTVSVQGQSDLSTPAIARFGSDYLKRNYLGPAIAGDAVACIGISEITGGSDVAALKSFAKRDGEDFVINGSKMWITNGTTADWMCMLVNTSHGMPHKNKSLIVVPMNAKGVTVGPKIDKLGLRCSDTAQIYFDNVRVPAKNLIGEEGMGFIYQMMQFQDERTCFSVSTCTAMDNIIDRTIDYCRTRRTFDQPIIDNQYVHFKLAELKSEVELLRSLTYRIADSIIAGENAAYLATIAKLKSGRLSRLVADQCLQFYGGMGYTSEMPISRAFRDCRIASIAGGTDEMMLGILAKMMNILPRKPQISVKQELYSN